MSAEALPSDILQSMQSAGGLRFAALLSPSGETLAQAGTPADAALLQAARAIAGSLQQALNAGELQDLLLELESGPVLFTPQGENTLVAGFDEVGQLGRVRFAVKRAAGQLTQS